MSKDVPELPCAIVSDDYYDQLKTKLKKAEALNKEWEEKAKAWLSSTESKKHLQDYRELGQRVAKAENRAEKAEALNKELREAMTEIRLEIKSDPQMNGNMNYKVTLDGLERIVEFIENRLKGKDEN